MQMHDYFLIQKAIIYATEKFSNATAEKPTLLHSVRCGLQLMENGFSTDVVVAGILHDTIEDTSATHEEISKLFGEESATIVSNNTKDSKIGDKNERREELIQRCCQSNYESIVVKLADINDNFAYYKTIKNDKLMDYCRELKSYVLTYLPDEFHTEYVDTQLNHII